MLKSDSLMFEYLKSEFCCRMLWGTVDQKESFIYEYVAFIRIFKSLNTPQKGFEGTIQGIIRLTMIQIDELHLSLARICTVEEPNGEF